MILLPIIIVITILLAVGAGFVVYKYTIEKPNNIAPVITVSPIINATSNQTIFINATVTDSDGSILTTIWDQKSGPQSNFTQVGEDLYVVPSTNGSYLFQIEVQDDKQAISVAGVLINVKSAEPPVQTECGVNEVWNGNTCECKDGYHQDETEACVPNTPPPKPVAKDIKITVVGDIEDSTAGNAVFQQIKKQNATYDFVLGDLGYESDLKWFKSTYGTLGDKMWCVIGNHDAENEDGTAAIEKEALEYCGNSYWIKNGVNLFVMLNTNDDQNTLAPKVGKIFDNSSIMNGVKNIHINGHKGCVTPPNSHHPAGEVKALCDYIKSKIPSNIKVWYNSAHNHVYSESADKIYKQSGAGGRSHYTCPSTTTNEWYCNNSSYGFLLYTIKPDGTTTSQFIDYNGVVKH